MGGSPKPGPLGQDFLLAINPIRMVVFRIESGSSRVRLTESRVHNVLPNTESQQKLKENEMLDATTIEELKASLRGELIQPNDGGYDEARSLYNGMID